MLLGLALVFAAAATIASFAEGWAVEANRRGRTGALALMTLFGLTMLVPTLAEHDGAFRVDWSRTSHWANGTTAACSILLGVATGLVWARHAGPVRSCPWT
jgi:cytochrome c biogenesis protein CcdA